MANETTYKIESEFKVQAEHIRVIAETMLREYYGDRCPDFEPSCIICRKWKALDDLLEDF